MSITKEYFDQQLSNLAATIDDRFSRQTEILMSNVNEQVETLARMVQAGFEDMEARLDVQERVKQLESDMRRIKEALHV